MNQTDVAIVGGGLAGSALAGALAGAGFRVQVLERTTEFEDRVRGEWMAPWGVAESKRLGLYDSLIAAGGHHLGRSINYDELLDPREAEARAMPLGDLNPDAPGPLTLQHVHLQNAALARATKAGAELRRGVSDVQVEAGARPRVRFQHDGASHEIGCRLIVGADGRASAVRRALEIAIREDPIDHLMSGLLVKGADGWPMDVQALGKAGDIHYLIFPQGEGRIRVYVDYDLSQRGRFSGAHGAANLLEAVDMDCVPNSRAIAEATPIGPCRAFPSQDAWTDRPFCEGAVLVGDAAGYNDPILGQGLSVTLRDVRIVRDLLLDSNDWTPALFEPYADERRERLRRLRFVAKFDTELFARFDERALERRRRAFARIESDPGILMILLAAYAGPETVDSEYFTPAFLSRVFAA